MICVLILSQNYYANMALLPIFFYQLSGNINHDRERIYQSVERDYDVDEEPVRKLKSLDSTLCLLSTH